MMATLLTLSHIFAFALGAVMWSFITFREGSALDDKPRKPKPQGHVPTLVLVILVGSLTMIGFGVQQSVFQASHEQRMDCIEKWGIGVVETAELRNQAMLSLSKAERDRTDAVDEVLLLVSNYTQKRGPGIANAPESFQKRYLQSLSEFEAAKKKLNAVRERAQTRRENNPYPPLDCE